MESNQTGSSVYFVATTSLPRIIMSCVWRLCLDKRHRGLVHKECCRAPVQLGGGGDWYATKDLYAGCTWYCLMASEVAPPGW